MVFMMGFMIGFLIEVETGFVMGFLKIFYGICSDNSNGLSDEICY